MTKARDLANIISGGFTADDIPNIDASKITSGTFADARIASSNVSQHAASFDDNKIVNDISTLAIRQASNENKGAYNTNSTYVDVFQDSTGYTNGANTTRDSNEYVSSTSNVAEANTKALWTTQIDNHGDAIGGSPGTPVVDATGTLQLQGTNTDLQTFSSGNAAPLSGFGTKSIRTASWDTGSNNKGYYIREVSGQTSDLNFGTGAFTVEMFVKQVSTGYSNSHQYVFDFNSAGNQRICLAPYGTNNNDGYSGDYVTYQSPTSYSWSNFGVGNWRHVAYVRDASGNHALFINGTRVGTSASTNQTAINYTDANELGIGHRHNGENAAYLYINNIRLSNIARYSATSSSLTVPTSRFTYLTSIVNATGNFTCPNVTASSSTNKMGAVVTYQDHAGTNALNTDIVLQLSADGGSNYSTATLTALPDFSTGIKMAKVNDLSVTAGTSLKYKISFANQASGSKEARIRGVSLQY